MADAPQSKARAHALTAHALKSRVLTHAASDLHDPVKNAGVSTISGYGSKELIGYTGGSQDARWQAAKSASKLFLMLHQDINLIILRQLHLKKLSKIMKIFGCKAIRIKILYGEE